MIFEINRRELVLEYELPQVMYGHFLDEDTVAGTQTAWDGYVYEATASIEHTYGGVVSRPYSRPVELDFDHRDFHTDDILVIDTLPGSQFLLRGFPIDGEASQSRRFFLVEERDASIYEIPIDMDETTELISVVMLDADSLLGLARPTGSSDETEYQLLAIEESGETSSVGLTFQNVCFDELAWYGPVLKPSYDRRYVAFLTTDGLVRVDTQTWSCETFVIPGLGEPIAWEIDPQGDGVAWVKDATLFYSRLRSTAEPPP
jgi:hypothetical protein